MKRKGYLFEKISSEANLYDAYINAAHGKHKRKEVQHFEADLENNLKELRNELLTHQYKTSDYSVFLVYEPKRREIYKLPFRDRVIQWAIMQVLEPIWCTNFTADTYACLRGRGIHALLRRLRRDLRKDPDGTRYCFKCDVRKFYPSITHEVLKSVVRRKIKDPDLLWLLDDIIDSAEGVPIGNYISQFFANLYLSELDHQLKEFIGVKYYYRYADDMVVLSDSKQYLMGVEIFVNDYLENSRLLHLKGNYQIYPVESRGIDFVGYVTYHTHVLARKKSKKALCRKVAKLRKKGYTPEQIRLMLASRLGFMVHCNSRNLLKKLKMKDWKEVKHESSGALTGTKLNIESILGRELHLQAVTVQPSKQNGGNCLTLQYELEEQQRNNESGELLWQDDSKTIPITHWVQHITFTGSGNLQKQLEGVDFSEAIRCKIIKQPCDRGKCFYKIVSTK